MSDQERCPECGSWGEECLSETPVADCGCARCLRARLSSSETLRVMAEKFHDVAVKERDFARAEAERLKAQAEHFQRAIKESAESRLAAQEKSLQLELLWKAEMEHANKWAARARKAEADYLYMNRIRDHLQGQVLELQRDRETACENTPTKGCECPGCCTARERAERGEA